MQTPTLLVVQIKDSPAWSHMVLSHDDGATRVVARVNRYDYKGETRYSLVALDKFGRAMTSMGPVGYREHVTETAGSVASIKEAAKRLMARVVALQGQPI